MVKLEELTPDTIVRGILPNDSITVLSVKWFGNDVVELTYKDSKGHLGNELLYRDREPFLEILQKGRPWSFDADGSLFRLASEAYRIHLAYLFDPYLAVTTSLVEPLPHQITAVYSEMLSRQPLRFLLADDPGAGKTIMTGLFIKELLIRGDLNRCLIVCPGNLVEQWQDELSQRFELPFEIITNDRIESARTGNVFNEIPLCISRLDKLSRDEELQNKLKETDWDLIVCDEAHKMSASFFSGDIQYTKRYLLGRALSQITRHFLLLTATPHNGKEEDFQLFMALLDGDRFEGRFRDGVHTVNVSDLMRRVVKENLVKFDGKPLFPERLAYTVKYTLSDDEAYLYQQVTDYVREEFNRADSLENDKRKGTVGFALTILQRRLASSPEAIYQSLRRRKERLEKRLREEEFLKRGRDIGFDWDLSSDFSPEELNDFEDAPGIEVESIEEVVVDQATAARTIAELRAEIDRLKELERLAYLVRMSGTDRKWDELSKLLQNNAEMFTQMGTRKKLVIFTEHRDTLNYLTERIRSLIGRQDSVVTISGSMGREERRKNQELFTQDKNVLILVATDAAGEGINLQRSNLMVNYDLPWNPNRIEQRFGRIHRIGQTEVCHLWNLVADETREGDVFNRLLEKIEQESRALGGQVFDVLGRIHFDNKPLRELLIEAIRYGERPDVKARLDQVIDQALNRENLQKLFEERSLATTSMDIRKVMAIKEQMERFEARKLQPHFIASFFLKAFKECGGTIYEREPGRYEITYVPASIRNRDRVIGNRGPILSRYERICFEKDLRTLPGKSIAEFITPGHPLLASLIDLVLEKNRELLKRGAVLIDSTDSSENIRILFFVENAIQSGRVDKYGNRLLLSRQVHFVEINRNGQSVHAGYAPYLDYRPMKEEESTSIQKLLDADWIDGCEKKAIGYAVEHLIPAHFDEVKQYRGELIQKTRQAVKDRLTKEINYWDHRAEELKLQEATGRINARMNSQKARQRADELASRLERRLQELEEEERIAPQPPQLIGGALIIPQGFLDQLKEPSQANPSLFSKNTAEIEQKAMEIVLALERQFGFEPKDVSNQHCGFDIESRIPDKGRLRFIEVKGRIKGATTVTITKNEILTALNKPEDYILAIVEVDETYTKVYYLQQPFRIEPDFAVTSVNYSLRELLAVGKVIYSQS
jgi:SNF2 family DNA or RNA helicase